MSSNVEELYKRIKDDPETSKGLFRQALQDPQGALKAICELGASFNLPVTAEEVKTYLARMDDDADTNQWLIKARGGL